MPVERQLRGDVSCSRSHRVSINSGGERGATTIAPRAECPGFAAIKPRETRTGPDLGPDLESRVFYAPETDRAGRLRAATVSDGVALYLNRRHAPQGNPRLKVQGDILAELLNAKPREMKLPFGQNQEPSQRRSSRPRQCP